MVPRTYEATEKPIDAETWIGGIGGHDIVCNYDSAACQ